MYNNSMAENYDVIVIGAGILGCFAARHLTKYDLRVAVLEKREDVCTEITRANSGIIYRGYDQHPDSLKANMCVQGSRGFEELCRELEVPYRKTGLLMLSFGPRGNQVLEQKWKNGMQLGIDRLHLVDQEQVYELEPHLCPGIRKALYAEDTSVVDPWELGIAAYENALQNGASFHFQENVTAIHRRDHGFLIETKAHSFCAEKVLCCAGLDADVVWEMAAKPRFRILPQAADYIVFDVMKEPWIRHVLTVEPEEKGGGITLIPTVSNNLLAGPTRRKLNKENRDLYYDTSEEGIRELLSKTRALVPDLPAETAIRSFGAVRPNPFYLESPDPQSRVSFQSIPDFLILEEEGFFSLAGVKTPGITCAEELGNHITRKILTSFAREVHENLAYDPGRKKIPRPNELSFREREQLIAKDPSYGRVLCRCREVTDGEVIEAIRRGATTVDGVKRRTGALMGRCQGSYCTERILKLLQQYTGQDLKQIRKNMPGSEML